MISRKYGEMVRGWNTGDIRGGYGAGLWKGIRKDLHTLSQNVIFCLGDDKRLWFWKHIWCGEVALSNVFPNLFNMAIHKEAMVADVWDFSRAEGGWSPVFVRDFNAWEMEEVERLLQLLHRRKFMSYQEDQLLLKGAKVVVFSARLMYRKLVHSPPIAFPSRSIWNPIVPPKIGFLAWEAS